MKQLLQYIRTGEAVVADVPVPQGGRGKVLVQVAASLVSAGTERMVVDFAEKNLLEKARARPDLVRQTLGKAQSEGVLATWDAVQNRLEQPMALGYACAGTVLAVGHDVEGIFVGDRVACAGSGYAVHAEVVAVPKNLVVTLPDNVDFETAAFTTLAAIALQGIRLSEAKLGEVVAVIGLGLLGQLTVQMLKTAGCRVIGMDIRADRVDLARQLGADAATAAASELESLGTQYTQGHGVDAVLITADTKSNQPVELAGSIARRKGIVVAVGAVGMHIPRKIYYEKELDFRISSSYGPGRYDPDYEEKGRDYPYAYVRWTEQRNMQAFVQMVASDNTAVQPLITHRFPIADATQAYDLITGKSGESFLGVLLTYPKHSDLSNKIVLNAKSQKIVPDNHAENLQQIRLGVLGAGLFPNATLLPAIKDLEDIQLVGIASNGGISARTTADRFHFDYCTTDSRELFANPDINTVALLTRHHLHAEQVIAGLNAGKHIFVEKPLCLTESELQKIVAAYQQTRQQKRPPQLMVGFNRRFAPYIIELKEHLQTISEPLMLHYRVNAGFIPHDHWTQDVTQGGGRLLGEGIHFIDLLIYLANAAPQRVTAVALPDSGKYSQDNFVITLEFANGSIGTLTYAANGDKGFSKEMLELFGGGLAARMDNYRTLHIQQGKKRVKRTARLRQDKGHQAEWAVWRDYLCGKIQHPMPFESIITTTKAAFAAQYSLQTAVARQIEPINLYDKD
ncbi:MAG: bi-domain-containing oxidoreductase [Anaerolineales bacterium]|nr:bi-domain-containing oxidoreductase [Anaerolineales bacterium]